MEKMFDVSKELLLKLKTHEGMKSVSARFPTDEEIIGRQRQIKVISKKNGEMTRENAEEADAALLEKIRNDNSSQFDEFEASRIVEQIMKASIEDVQPVENGYKISLEVPGGIVTHTVKVPTAKEIIQFRRNYGRVMDLHFGKQQYTINLTVAADMFQKIIVGSSGYASEVPINHKVAVVTAAIEAFEADSEVSDTESF